MIPFCNVCGNLLNFCDGCGVHFKKGDKIICINGDGRLHYHNKCKTKQIVSKAVFNNKLEIKALLRQKELYELNLGFSKNDVIGYKKDIEKIEKKIKELKKK